MLSLKFSAPKCETKCRLALGRIKLMKNKKNQQVKMQRKEIADLLRSGKQDYARIKVEAVIRENLTLHAYEILELYLELVAVRSALIAQTREIPRDMIEAISSIIYAGQRVADMPELLDLQKVFAAKYGKEYVAEASHDVHCKRWQVNENLRRCLTIEPPQGEDKLSMLSEIAQEYNVEWDIERASRELLPQEAPFIPSVITDPTGIQQDFVTGPGMGAPTPQFAPPRVQGGYASVNEAAAAAVQAAQQAQQAAEHAARLARERDGDGNRPGGGNGAPPPPGPSGGGGGGAPAAGWLLGHPPVFAPPAPVMGQNLSGEAPVGPSPPTSSVPSSGTHVGGYKVKTEEELRKAYEEAQGPPVKFVEGPTAPPPTSSPSVPPAPNPPASGPAVSSQDGGLPLPSPPRTGAAPAPSGDPGFDELQRRFEMLKKS